MTKLASSLGEGFIGDSTRDVKICVPTYLKKKDIDLETRSYDLCGGYASLNIRFYIDTRRLLKLRHMYHDPDSIWGSQSDNPEAGFTYFVIGGIPIFTMKAFVIWSNEPPEIIAHAKKWGGA